MIFLHLLLISPVICQFSPGMRPDISFGVDSDRFDISHVFRAMRRPHRGHSPEDSRRSAFRSNIIHKPEDIDSVRDKSYTRDDQEDKNDIFITRRNLNDFVDIGFDMADDMANEEFDSINDFERNLDNYKNHRQRRRVANQIDTDKLSAAERKRKLDRIVDELHGITGSNRRFNKDINIDPEDEILFHNAIIFNVKVKGLLQPNLY